MTHPKEAVEADHAAWFMAEHPHTYRDMLAEEMSARVIFAHSYVAWKAALDRAEADKAAAVDAEKERCAEIAESIDAVAFRARYEVTYTKKRFDQYSHEKGVNQALNIQAEDAAAAIRAGAKP